MYYAQPNGERSGVEGYPLLNRGETAPVSGTNPPEPQYPHHYAMPPNRVTTVNAPTMVMPPLYAGGNPMYVQPQSLDGGGVPVAMPPPQAMPPGAMLSYPDGFLYGAGPTPQTPFRTGLFDCTDDGWDTCCMGMFCWPLLGSQDYSMIRGRTDMDGKDWLICAAVTGFGLLNGTSICCSGLTLMNRMELRRRYGMNTEELCEDILSSFFCGPCTECQLRREMKLRGLPPPSPQIAPPMVGPMYYATSAAPGAPYAPNGSGMSTGTVAPPPPPSIPGALPPR
jgi:Cys-rich protein (TIGR01571 family)